MILADAFSLALVVLAANLTAIGVHASTWWLRRRCRGFLYGIGVLTLACALVAGCFFWGLAIWAAEKVPEKGPDFVTVMIRIIWATEEDADIAASIRRIIRKSSGLELLLFLLPLEIYIGAGIVGLCQARQIPVRWWKAILLFWGEIGFALPAVILAELFLTVFLGAFLEVFALSFFVLALFRPLFLRFADTILQTWRDWFRLNYRGSEVQP